MKRNARKKPAIVTRSKQARIARQTLQIATLAPVVASARMLKTVSTRGRSSTQHFSDMGSEKAAAFTSATVGMMFAGMSAMTRSAVAMAGLWSPWGGTVRQRMARVQSAVSDASADVALGALAPIRKRVVANSKRLGR